MCHCHSCCSSQGCGCQSSHGKCGCQSSSCHSKSSCCASSCGCSCQCHHSCGGASQGDHCEHAHKLLCIADMAWMEILKEKIKEHIQSSDHKIDEIARIVAEANHERWQQKMSNEQCCSGYEEKLNQLFHSQCQTKGQQSNNKNNNNKNSNIHS